MLSRRNKCERRTANLKFQRLPVCPNTLAAIKERPLKVRHPSGSVCNRCTSAPLHRKICSAGCSRQMLVRQTTGLNNSGLRKSDQMLHKRRSQLEDKFDLADDNRVVVLDIGVLVL